MQSISSSSTGNRYNPLSSTATNITASSSSSSSCLQQQKEINNMNNNNSSSEFFLKNAKKATTTTLTDNKKSHNNNNINNMVQQQQQQQQQQESSSSSSLSSRPSSSSMNPPPLKKQRSEEDLGYNTNKQRVFSIEDVDVLDLVCHATWIFDITNKKFLFGNTAALEFWKADCLEDFVNRSFDDMSETTMKKNLDILERLKRNEKWAESWTFYPNNGKPVSVSMKVSPIYILDSNTGKGHLCQFSEAIPATPTEEEKVSPDFLRAASMLRYLPMAVSQFNSKTGKLMHQNPEACSVFGWPSSTLSNCNHTCNSTTTNDTTNNNNDVTASGNDNDHDGDGGPVSMDVDVDDDDDLSSSSNGGCCTCKEEDKASSTMKSTETTTTSSSSSSSSATLEDPLKQQQQPIMDSTAAAAAASSIATSTTTTMRHSTSTSSLFSLCSNTMLEEEDNNNNNDQHHVHDQQHDHHENDNSKDVSLVDEDRSSSQEDAANVVVDEGGGDPSSNHFLSRFVDKKLAQKLLKKIKSGQDVSVEALVHTKSGPEWNAIHARLAMDAVSEDPVILYTARDISEIINAKKEMQLNLERAEFFAIMAHEIRTPLFQVTGFIDLLDETDLNKEQRDFIKLLRAAASSLMTVINDVLDYSKLEAGKMKLDIVPFEPKAVVDGSMAAIAPSAEDKGITLKTNFARVGVPVKLMGDPNRLRQVLLNLLQNAIKFTHTGSIEASVDLVSTCISSSSIGCDDDNCSQKNKQKSQVMLRFSIKDTGIGISKEHMDNIFRKYTQAAASIATSYGGTGLGLSICKSLVECMGGNIGVDSLLGQGSVFWFQIPFDRVQESSESPSPKNGEKAAGMGTGSCQNQTRQLKVLVAEDNGVSRKMISKMLKSLGHDTTVVENGEEAMKEVRLRDGKFDLILMDMQMPVMDGIDATKHIRSMGYTAVPIVGLTASVRRGDFQNLGLDDWIGKPVRLKELQKRLSSYFDDPVDDTETSAPGGGGDGQGSPSATQPRPGLSTVGIDSLSISIRQRESLLEAPPPENTKVTSKLFAENKMRNNMSIEILPAISLPKS